jgi:hypothetical protein
LAFDALGTFLDLPSYTIYSATGSFFIPTLLMFFVYFKANMHLIYSTPSSALDLPGIRET